jgi:integrase
VDKLCPNDQTQGGRLGAETEKANHIREKGIPPDERLFLLTCAGVRYAVFNAAQDAGVHVRPHDLRRHAATHLSRSQTSIEIISKVILRHSDLSNIQRYLGKAAEGEAIRRIDNLHA